MTDFYDVQTALIGGDHEYAGIGSFGPYFGMSAILSSPVILGTVRYTGNRVMKLRGFQYKPVVPVAFTLDMFVTVGIRRVTNYTALDTGGTNVSQYFGAPLNGRTPPVECIDAVIATAGGSAGLTAGTRTVSNYVVQDTVKFTKATTFDGAWYSMAVPFPVEISKNEGWELVALQMTTDPSGVAKTPDTTGYAAVVGNYVWTVEDR